MRTKIENSFIAISPAKIGMGFAWLGVLIYASSNSIATLLVDIGSNSPVAGGRNAITFTNLLFLSSLISIVPMVVLFRKDWTGANLRHLNRRDWGLLTLSAFLSSALTPGLFFYALEHSSVTSVLLISRIEPPLFLLAAGLFLKEQIKPRVFLAAIIALCGAMLMISMRDPDSHGVFGAGEIAAAAGALSYITSAIFARKALRCVPMGIFSIYRATIGTLIYFLLISALQGPQQFQDIFSPVLLKWIWVYAIIVVIIGQLSWFMALKYARSDDMSLATSFSPLAGIIFAMLLLAENPGPAFVPGGALILLAICVGRMNGTISGRLQRIGRSLGNGWQMRPTCAPGDIAQVLVPVAAFNRMPRQAYTGSY
ncbi:EamA-like transporter family protein [Roseovarius litorisediminis]|uniref:EamA-like transporter family protein n=1 Tax=Roseovarius litorisediminis TaxID=1312363 RepID=A0A1Y5TU75_9RHOB|nr:DMT family transporter [Roseovarius litorisediminis]SLN69832.1 EamA-like transporter family protein [Roseovarius litorisediminis]